MVGITITCANLYDTALFASISVGIYVNLKTLITIIELLHASTAVSSPVDMQIGKQVKSLCVALMGFRGSASAAASRISGKFLRTASGKF